MTHTRTWIKPEGAEYASIDLAADHLIATGTAVGGDPMPYRLTYRLTTTHGWVTSRLLVETEGGSWRRRLDLRHHDGTWTIDTEADGSPDLPPPGGDPAALTGALDCDLGLSPLTNTMPVLRAGLLHGGGPVDFLMAWVSVPDLAVVPSTQTYTFVRRLDDGASVRFASPGFTREVEFDASGLVRDYPSIGRAV
ncbi:hypothetical protein Afil01_30050 [Actinorhabdospora filicis]|uniref:Glycolipid-binding domain-containing protein n=1 Tax=Actinorhabdospora filicis TaxID=1785913 RepID=A0A9W6SL16_9ACTN|nr:putative glycolipid-binding domain-containing protein [Actinorhabdospora filicis]GLZ78198.1 hypothetical protein Afil01_30050 [Actinorhabdospora filicis]